MALSEKKSEEEKAKKAEIQQDSCSTLSETNNAVTIKKTESNKKEPSSGLFISYLSIMYTHAYRLTRRKVEQ